MELTIEQALQQGVAAHKEGKVQEAERLYRSILQSQPAHADANHNLGIIAVSVNKVELALPLFKTAIEANPKTEQFWLSYIDALIKEKHFEAAKQVIQQAKKQGIDGEKLNALKAQLVPIFETGNANSSIPSQQQLNSLLEHYQSGRYGEAEKLAVSITEQFPTHPSGWKVLGAVLGQTGRKSEAVNANQKTVELSPKDTEAYNNLGITLHELGRLEEAEASYRQAIAIKPGYAEAHSNLGNTLKQLGKLKEAETSYTQAITLKPDYAEAHINLGSLLSQIGRSHDAEVSYRQAVALKSDFYLAHYNLGNALKELGRLDEAEASYRQSIALKPDFAEAHYNLGNALKELGRWDEAEASYRQSIALKPDFAEAHYNLGNALKELGRWDEAEASYRQSISIKPGYAEAHSNLGNVLKELGRLDEAEASYTQAIALKLDYAQAHYNLGVTLQELCRLEEAEASYKQAIALKPDYAEAHSNLGATLLELGRLKESEASSRQAIALKPDHAFAHSNLGMTLTAMGLIESALPHFERNLQLTRGTNPLDLHHKSFSNISKAKIDHDIEQFEYLAASGYESKRFHELATLYKMVSSDINCALDTDVLPISNKHSNLLGDTYNRPIHILEAPALEKAALGDSLDVDKITENYFEHEFGLTYIDDFLSPIALKSLREFFLGSTIWFDFFHSGGYMGAYLREGLATPLILQVAEDLRKKFPKIFKKHHLAELWAYKYDSRACEKNNSFTGIKPHADFAAVNVNFWITPKSANLDPSSGGLVVYNAEAPLEWNFKEYNNDQEKIHKEILKSNQKKTIVPYNENRAVIFNSNLFHKTDKIEFREGYENRRINVTMLFGKRRL